MARRARGARCPVPLSPGPTVRATRAPRRGGDPRAPAASRGRAVRYVLLVAAVLTTLAAALLLGPANVPFGDLLASPIVWQLRLPRALLAFLVGGALWVSGVGFLGLWGGFGGGAGTPGLVILGYPPLPLVVLFAAARPLDLLALGDEPAQYLGADVRRLKRLVYLSASLLTAAAVAVAGVIGFVGLIVPHVCRLLWGRLHHTLFPTAFLAGGILLAPAHTLARTGVAPRELPVGIVTALLGVPLFAFLLRRWTVS